MPKELILLTAGFPYGTSETFLETEIHFLSEAFDKVRIIAINPNEKNKREIPDNCTAESLYISVGIFQKIVALVYVFHPLFWRELTVIRKEYKQSISKGILQTILISLYRAHKIQKHLHTSSENLEGAILYSYWCDDSALALALVKRKSKELKAISRMHGWDVYFEVHPLNYLPYRHFISKQINCVFAISENGKNYATSNWGVNSKNFQIARLGVRKQLFTEINDNFLLVSCSNLIPLKRVDLIMNALRLIQNKSLRWVHFGDGIEMEKIKNLASEKLPSNITAELKGRVSNAKVMQWYATHQPSLFINVSSSEGVPVSIMEAMSFGIPVIATDVGGNNEIVTAANGTLLSENPKVEEVTEAIERIMQLSQDAYKELKNAAYTTWELKYNAEKNYVNFANKLIEI